MAEVIKQARETVPSPRAALDDRLAEALWAQACDDGNFDLADEIRRQYDAAHTAPERPGYLIAERGDVESSKSPEAWRVAPDTTLHINFLLESGLVVVNPALLQE